MSKPMSEIEQAITHLEAMAATLNGLVVLLRKMAARTWPDIPNGEGVAGEISAGIPEWSPADTLEWCVCGHHVSNHTAPNKACWTEFNQTARCQCQGFIGTMTDPRD